MMVAAIFFFLSAGLVVKLVYSPVSGNNSGSALLFQSASSNNANLDGQVKITAIKAVQPRQGATLVRVGRAIFGERDGNGPDRPSIR